MTELLKQKLNILQTRAANERAELRNLQHERDKIVSQIKEQEAYVRGLEEGVSALDAVIAAGPAPVIPAAAGTKTQRRSPGEVAEAVMSKLSVPPYHALDAQALADKTGHKAASIRAAAKKLVADGKLVATTDGWTLHPSKKGLAAQVDRTPPAPPSNGLERAPQVQGASEPAVATAAAGGDA